MLLIPSILAPCPQQALVTNSLRIIVTHPYDQIPLREQLLANFVAHVVTTGVKLS